jgi:hypothetical protein
MQFYVNQSTNNPTGFRPWGYKLSGLGCGQQLGCGGNCGCGARGVSGLVATRRRRTFSGLGSTTPDVGTLQTQANHMAAQIAQMNQDLMATQTQIQMLNAQGMNTQTEATQLMQQRNDYENIVSQFTVAYRALFGTTPPGLSQLGIDPVTLASIAAALAIVASLIAIWWEHESALKAAAASKLQQQQNIAAAIAAGDTATAQMLANAAGAPTNFTDWLSQNWMYVAMGVGGLIVLQKVL